MSDIITIISIMSEELIQLTLTVVIPDALTVTLSRLGEVRKNSPEGEIKGGWRKKRTQRARGGRTSNSGSTAC